MNSNQMHKSHKWFKNVTKNLPIGCFVLGPDGTIEMVNATALTWLGFEEKEMLHMHLSEFVRERDKSKFKDDITQRLAGKDVPSLFWRTFRQKDANSYLPCEVRDTVIMRSNCKTNESKGARMIVTIADVSARMQLDLGCTEPDPAFLSYTHTLPGFVYLFRKNCAGDFTFGNRAFWDYVGVSSSTALNGYPSFKANDATFFKQPMPGNFTADDDDVRKNGCVFESIEANQRLNDLEPQYVHVIKFPVLDVMGHDAGVQGIFWNVKKRKEALIHLDKMVLKYLAYLRVTEETYQSVLQNTSQGVFRSTKEGKFVLVNTALLHMLGYTPEDKQQLLDMDDVSALYVGEFKRSDFIAKMEPLQHHKPAIVTYEIRARDGQSRLIKEKAWPIRDPQTQKICFFEGICEDVENTRKEEVRKGQERRFGFLRKRICNLAYERLVCDDSVGNLFKEGSDRNAFVLSIDLRRSTGLMQRAKQPQLYAAFLNALCEDLSDAITEQFGVIDKFTGDGLLAYFSAELSGIDAGYRALVAAEKCHLATKKLLLKSRAEFDAVFVDDGLGIGIDYGNIRLLKVTSELTILGPAVVYACRLSAAPAGHTYVNHSVVDELSKRCTRFFDAKECLLEIKHEGTMVCQDIKLVSSSTYKPAGPDWLSDHE
ncbi:MAG: PAS domain S-box protein [Verrucomicrobiota bacterium]